MRAIFEALVLLAIISVATISCAIAYSENQAQTYPANSTAIDNNKSSILNDTIAVLQPTEDEPTISPSQNPSPTHLPIPNISDIKLSQWTSDSDKSLVIIDSPAKNSVYTSSTITLTVHASAQEHIILIGVDLKTDWAGTFQLFNNINSGWLCASQITITATLTGIPDGSHWITVSANDYCVPAGASVTVNFTVDTSKEFSRPTANPSALPSPTRTHDSTITPNSAYPEGLKDWLPYGTFAVSSPTNQTYNVTTILLNVSGNTIAGSPLLSYGLDGSPPVLMSLASTKVSMAQTAFYSSVSLQNLAIGSHVIVVYGDLGFESRRAKITINFEVQAQ